MMLLDLCVLFDAWGESKLAMSGLGKGPGIINDD